MTKQAELKQQAYASSLKSRALSVLIYLIDRSNKDLTCYPAIPTMAVQLHISISTVKRALKELVDTGYIEKASRFRERNRGQSSNLYTLLFVEQIEPDKDNTSTEKTNEDVIDADNKVRQSCYIVQHITFDDLSESAEEAKKVETRTQSILEFEKGYNPSLRKEVSYPPIQPENHRHAMLKTIFGNKKMADPLTVCHSFSYWWTGGGVPFATPLNDSCELV